ncbi:MAG: 50S ribosomal protein L6 [uncultured bacterium]|nr:MAG: 50S ribosomal protein L6 [uncultured bacterium]KKP68976.1 MAG: 50S ribosomal protein L6 [Candidatus Moranbacteria bacterium GW2011_GWE1_35_17]KKP72381.1 MAG: 50S ribosomal protein L6 [Candidatus Moranbacteria bacterium GW2011_GWE2_35_164]KKP84329.1 MAG: 50S ribosomal protein L6 [Candidatus Moranbacteria bacterium GW2011_GWF1_35_5]KKP84756.1 MAG: 50S ribosomal protein L6 [Candidatus Moranbacteria bacterium GW2011_GWF2_35_54]HBR78817.1 50S ribosomal protein L6 [Candidatus Moranbacteria b
MSRIGKKPIEIPQGVTVEMVANKITVSGSKGKLELVLVHDVKVEIKDNLVVVDRANSSKKASAMWGTTNRLIGNMITGVSVGFSKVLELNGVGFRMEASGKNLKMALGFSHPVNVIVPEGLEVKVENNTLAISGIDKQVVGQFAAEIRSLKPVEPYKGKGFRYVGEIVRRKEGKKASA